jgi:hypothetical protein
LKIVDTAQSSRVPLAPHKLTTGRTYLITPSKWNSTPKSDMIEFTTALYYCNLAT